MVANEPVNMRRLPKKGTTSNLAVLIKGLIVGELALVGVAAYFWHKLYYDQVKCFSGNVQLFTHNLKHKNAMK